MHSPFTLLKKITHALSVVRFVLRKNFGLNFRGFFWVSQLFFYFPFCVLAIHDSASLEAFVVAMAALLLIYIHQILFFLLLLTLSSSVVRSQGIFRSLRSLNTQVKKKNNPNYLILFPTTYRALGIFFLTCSWELFDTRDYFYSLMVCAGFSLHALGTFLAYSTEPPDENKIKQELEEKTSGLVLA